MKRVVKFLATRFCVGNSRKLLMGIHGRSHCAYRHRQVCLDFFVAKDKKTRSPLRTGQPIYRECNFKELTLSSVLHKEPMDWTFHL